LSGEDVLYAGVAALGKAYRARRVSPVEVVSAHLARIASADPTLRAYITVTADRAMEQARRAEEELRGGLDRGVLHGIPYAVKDQLLTAGIRTTAGSPLLAEWIPPVDATAVERLDNAGAVLLGKLNMMELALGRPRHYAYGIPRNPWNPAHEAGGSSSGSGAALAAGMATVTLGEDTGGSVRHPAAHCGVVGLRPTWGLVSRYGLIPAVWHLDTVGPMARTIEDVAVVLRAIAGRDLRDPTTHRGIVPDYLADLDGGVRGIRIGLIRELLTGPGLSNEALGGVQEAANVLRRLGASLKDVSIPLALHAGVIYTAFAEPEAARVHLPGLRHAADRYDRNVRIRLSRGLLIPAAAGQWAAEVGRKILVAQITDALASCDVLLAPTTPTAAPRIDEVHHGWPVTEEDVQGEFGMQSYRMTLSFHGGPVLAVCCGFNHDGLPLSLQITAAPHRDALVLRIGHAYQRATGWHLRRPRPVPAGPGVGGYPASLS
jgi:aspartyl-tRNA(Asn)/glutamyl-tRNA(Gln) amidotransferase subunit A